MRLNDLQSLIIDQPDIGRFDVARRLYTDEELFELEMKHIFERTWIYLCHESQVAAPHDYFTTRIGRQPVFVIRGEDSKLRCFINACSHRGATLCRTSRGNAKFLTCSYHGWTYDAAGNNVAVKDLKSGGYPDAFLKQNHDLTQIARLDSYAGFIFGSLVDEGPNLHDHLGATRPFMEMMDEMGPEGCEVLPGRSTYTYKGNWKPQLENGLDGYHFTSIHANYVGVINHRASMATKTGGTEKIKVAFDDSTMHGNSGCYDFHDGHGLIWIDFPLPENRPLWQEREKVQQRVGRVKADWMLKRQRNLMIYPSVQLNEHASSQIRVFRPLTPNLTETTIYCIAPKGENPEAREIRIRQYEDFFNASGMATSDDLSVFEDCQVGFEGRKVEQQGYERGYGRIAMGADKLANELGIEPYSHSSDACDETHFHGQYRAWLRLMSDGVNRDNGR